MDDRVGITLIRHGMTKENERSAYIGWMDSPLSENGRLKVESYSDLWENTPIDYVFSSDLTRCVDTANILFPHQPLQKVQNLREVNFGKWEGKTYEELKHVPAYRAWLNHMFVSGPDEGEDFPMFSKRIEAAFAEVKSKMLKDSLTDVAVVTHGGVIRCLLMMLVDSNKSFFDWKTPYGCGYRLCWKKEQFRRGDMCTSLQEVPITERQHG